MINSTLAWCSATIERHLVWMAPVLAFLVYGSWAYWVHRHPDSTHSWRAGIAQGGYAALSTVALRSLVLGLQRLLDGLRFSKLLTFALSFAAIVLVPTVLHRIVGNSRPWLAIAPGVVVGSIYIALIVWVSKPNRHSSRGAR